MKTRPNVAGPDLAVEDAQMIGPRRVRYALCTDGSDPWLLAEHAWIPVVVTEAQGVGHLPARGSRLEIYGGEVSALRRRDGYLEIRVFNPTPEATTVRIPGRNGTLVDLRRRDLIRWDGEFELGPWKIVNARLSNVSLD